MIHDGRRKVNRKRETLFHACFCDTMKRKLKEIFWFWKMEGNVHKILFVCHGNIIWKWKFTCQLWAKSKHGSAIAQFIAHCIGKKQKNWVSQDTAGAFQSGTLFFCIRPPVRARRGNEFPTLSPGMCPSYSIPCTRSVGNLCLQFPPSDFKRTSATAHLQPIAVAFLQHFSVTPICNFEISKKCVPVSRFEAKIQTGRGIPRGDTATAFCVPTCPRVP